MAMEVPSIGSHSRLTGGTICWLRYLFDGVAAAHGISYIGNTGCIVGGGGRAHEYANIVSCYELGETTKKHHPKKYGKIEDEYFTTSKRTARAWRRYE